MADDASHDPGEGSVPAPERAAVRLLRSAAAVLGLGIEEYCGGWAIRLVHPDGRTQLVWGFNFDLNPSAGAHIAKDKAASFELLRAAGVAAVEHRLFLRADLEEYVATAGNWRAMLATLEEFGGDAVIKPADGSGGAGVTRVRSGRELEQVSLQLWERHHAICLSPFQPITRELRHILLDGESRIAYEKQIDALVGDGGRTLGELIAAQVAAAPERWRVILRGAVRAGEASAWDHVLATGERLPLAWKHNLRGARAVEVEDTPLAALSRRAAEALGLRICAVDVIETAGNSSPRVLEVNAGLMLERYVEQVEGGWERAQALTVDVLRRMFERTVRG